MEVRMPLRALALVALLPAFALQEKQGDWAVSKPFGPTTTLTFTTDEGTWMSIDVHPDGKTLIFDLLGDLYTLPIIGGEAKRVTDGGAYDYQPRFSPDGKKVLFTSDRRGMPCVWIADFIDGAIKEPKAITEEKAQRMDGGEWDPSGQWIYVRRRTTDTSSIGVSELWAYHVDGGSG